MNEKAFQDYWQQNQCWGCGNNEHGLHIKSYWDVDESICVWQPNTYHMAGPAGFLNGGIIATIIDCHSICTAIANEYRIERRDLDSKPLIWCVTASLKLHYLLPTPVDKPLTLKAKVKEKEKKKTLINCSLISNKLETVKAEVLAVRVNPDKWYK